MNFILNKSLYAILFMLFAFDITGQATEQIEVDGFLVNYASKGIASRKPGQPVVVFESGMGTDLGNWYKIFDEIAEFAPVFAYDRPGIGLSQPDNEVPTTRNLVSKLRKMLGLLDISPPYILVGHSLGGAYVRGYASLFPEEIVGLIIIDPADFTESREKRRLPYREVGLSETKIDSIINELQNGPLDPQMPKSIQEEKLALREMRNNDFRTETAKDLPHIPIFIITSVRYENYPGGEALFRAKMKYRVERWSNVLIGNPQGRLVNVVDAGHFVHIDDPKLVISCVRITYEEAMANSTENEEP